MAGRKARLYALGVLAGLTLWFAFSASVEIDRTHDAPAPTTRDRSPHSAPHSSSPPEAAVADLLADEPIAPNDTAPAVTATWTKVDLPDVVDRLMIRVQERRGMHQCEVMVGSGATERCHYDVRMCEVRVGFLLSIRVKGCVVEASDSLTRGTHAPGASSSGGVELIGTLDSGA